MRWKTGRDSRRTSSTERATSVNRPGQSSVPPCLVAIPNAAARPQMSPASVSACDVDCAKRLFSQTTSKGSSHREAMLSVS